VDRHSPLYRPLPTVARWRSAAGGTSVLHGTEGLLLGRPVALEFLPEELAQDRRLPERFHRELRAAFEDSIKK
jgi:hypothetical protein